MPSIELCLGQALGCLGGPRFALRGSLKGDIDTGIDIDVDMDIDSDMAVFFNWGSFKRGLGLL